jgi:RNA recognition motif-containing protein
MNIYVSNLAFNVVSEDLNELFGNYGQVNSVNIIMDRETGRSRGFAFVDMADDTAGEQAIQELNQQNLQGRSLSVTKARPKEDKGSFGVTYGGNYNKDKKQW